MRISVLVIVTLGIVLTSCSESRQSERIFSHFLKRHVERVRPIMSMYEEATWATYTGKSSFSELLEKSQKTDSLYKNTGEPEYYQSLLNNVYDNATDFELLVKIKKSGLIKDSILKREFLDVFREYVYIQNNWDETDQRKTKLYEQFFELKRSESAFWDSIKHVEGVVNYRKEWIDRYAGLSEDFRDMVKAMNNDAQRLGYKNYYQMILDFNGVDYESIDKISKIVEDQTQQDYQKLMHVTHEYWHKNYGLSKDQLRPKHYAQSINQMMVPKEWKANFTQEECIDVISEFFELGDYNIDGIVEKSDLWYAENKANQSFFFCNNANEGDFRIYANLKPNTIGVYTLLHEFGHAVHYKYVDENVPYLLRDPHEIATEGVAIYFNDKLYHSPTLRNMMGINIEPASPYYQAFLDPSRLVFLRKLVRTIQFEKSIFENPNQDFNALWWELNEKYLLYATKKADRLPEWISNHHIINASGIHVFYLFAFAFSAQLEHYYPDDNIAPIKSLLMKHGDSMEWDLLLEHATGERLNLSYLFNSYKWKNRKEVPITFEVKPSDGLSYLEEMIEEKEILFTLDLRKNTSNS